MTPIQRLSVALTTLRPGAAWSLYGDTLQDLVWLDDTQSPPTEDEVFQLLGQNAVPQSVTPKQARLVLSQAGLLPQVNAMVRAADEATQITWDYALTINRDDPLIIQMGTALGLSDTDIDNLFVQAAQIP